MPTYTAPVQDSLFILNDVLNIERYNNLPGFADATPDMLEAILGEAGKMSAEVLQPLNEVGDKEGCVWTEGDGFDNTVKTPTGFKEAYDLYSESGWGALPFPEEYGGQGLPATLNAVVQEYVSSANMAFGMYPGLTAGAAAALVEHASEEQKQAYVPKMLSGEWSGTMNLTEPHCGTDLGMLRTKAARNDDGSFAITGQKIWISAGEHDMSSNIIHLVIARIEGEPEGTKGISLFVCPKYILDEDGNPGERNKLSCGSLEHKMGINGNATCVMNYEGAKAFLVGEENKGLAAMFVMMNEARLGVAVQGLAQSEVAYQNAADWARDRVQGRALTGAKYPDQKADPIIVHPDIRRVLLTIRSFNEAARALVLWTALKGDLSHRSDDEDEKQNADDIMGLLTPVLKGVLTDKGFDNTVMAQQVFGGTGYTKDQGVEQFVRDARIAMIYEGANGIQALDLVGRKLPSKGGRAVQAYFKEVGKLCSEHKDDEAMKPYVEPLSKALGDLQAATMWLVQNGMANPNNAGAASTDYMHLFGLVAMGHMWVLMAKTAQDKLSAGANGSTDYMNNKLLTGRFFAERMMPETRLLLKRIETGADTMMEMDAAAF
ncbi:acyl-CoA dehydrogenase C-terminal domain-containing protein [Ahrensia sp. R2A130]|uniref:acyl-CoA dehydrogenase C-terminal domain-containing protein n=1 Tax=Ahrensia sp. R2A130 TaxID=744979 RepID=UPI0001E0CA27|nr:acyl-CoA dehydrogenase C-terminal domain-containing protein [Ahrensia sp. R2A130]EFL87865.1 acyl-CoA dehydrogenase domain-containing protein [Ahrensia sp. R2A130]